MRCQGWCLSQTTAPPPRAGRWRRCAIQSRKSLECFGSQDRSRGQIFARTDCRFQKFGNAQHFDNGAKGLAGAQYVETHLFCGRYQRFRTKGDGASKAWGTPAPAPHPPLRSQKARVDRKNQAETSILIRNREVRNFTAGNHESPCGIVGSDELKTAICNRKDYDHDRRSQKGTTAIPR